MKNYVKPLVVANEELAEGIYADSGTGAWDVVSQNDIESDMNTRATVINLEYVGGDSVPEVCNVVVTYSGTVSDFKWYTGDNQSGKSQSFAIQTLGSRKLGFTVSASTRNDVDFREKPTLVSISAS